MSRSFFASFSSYEIRILFIWSSFHQHSESGRTWKRRLKRRWRGVGPQDGKEFGKRTAFFSTRYTCVWEVSIIYWGNKRRSQKWRRIWFEMLEFCTSSGLGAHHSCPGPSAIRAHEYYYYYYANIWRIPFMDSVASIMNIGIIYR